MVSSRNAALGVTEIRVALHVDHEVIVAGEKFDCTGFQSTVQLGKHQVLACHLCDSGRGGWWARKNVEQKDIP